MKRSIIVALSVVFVLCLGGVAGAAVQWYDVTFTGRDVWTYSADNALQARTGQDAPRRYRDWTQPGGSEVQATTYGYPAPGGATGFGAWAPGSGFAFDEINLWGAGGTAAAAWGETYVSVGTAHPDHGFSSWKVIQSPTGWTNGIVVGGDDWSADETHAFPVWRSAGDLDMLGLANMNNPSFVFEFQVLADSATLDSDGKLRVFFGGYKDDEQGMGPGNYEVSGVMTLTATPIPEPATIIVWSLLGMAAVAFGIWRRKRAA